MSEQAHQLQRLEDGSWLCVVCRWKWLMPPTTDCPGIERYLDWSHVPPRLTSATTLRRGGLKPGPIRGCIQGDSSMWVWLYDRNEATPRRSTPRQEATLKRGRETMKRRKDGDPDG